MQRVENEIERIGLAKIEVLYELVDDERRVLGLEAHHADVQVRVVVQETHLGGVPRRIAGSRRVLDEVGGRSSQFPGGLFETPIEGYLFFGDPDGLDDAAQPNRLVVNRRRRGTARAAARTRRRRSETMHRKPGQTGS